MCYECKIILDINIIIENYFNENLFLRNNWCYFRIVIIFFIFFHTLIWSFISMTWWSKDLKSWVDTILVNFKFLSTQFRLLNMYPFSQLLSDIYYKKVYLVLFFFKNSPKMFDFGANIYWVYYKYWDSFPAINSIHSTWFYI